MQNIYTANMYLEHFDYIASKLISVSHKLHKARYSPLHCHLCLSRLGEFSIPVTSLTIKVWLCSGP